EEFIYFRAKKTPPHTSRGGAGKISRRLFFGRKADLLADLEMLRIDTGIGGLELGQRDTVSAGDLRKAVAGLDRVAAVGGNRAGSGTIGRSGGPTFAGLGRLGCGLGGLFELGERGMNIAEIAGHLVERIL